jgi:hypothetical protein
MYSLHQTSIAHNNRIRTSVRSANSPWSGEKVSTGPTLSTDSYMCVPWSLRDLNKQGTYYAGGTETAAEHPTGYRTYR